jgi:23S rRNA pseudouridine1911/1915/1917 synthase
LRLLERRQQAWLVEVTIASGRPHQIRIHTAAAGAPLLGDPLYAPGGLALDQALPGDGGYSLHAHRLRLACRDGGLLPLEAPLPEVLRGAADG